MSIRGFLSKRRRVANLKRLAQENARLRAGLSRGALRVGLVSSDEYLGKITDDFLLERAFLRRGMDAVRVSWEDAGVDFGKFDGLLVTSMWGYQNYLEEFFSWLSGVEKSGVPIFNSAEIIRANCDKVRQFEILDRAGAPHVETAVFRDWSEEAEREALARFGVPMVVKPAISASGEGVRLIRKEEDFEKYRGEFEAISRERALLVQPFVPEIRDGELGVILIDGRIVNVVRRFPGVIDGDFHVEVEPVDSLDEKVREICKKVVSAPEYKNILYARIDFVKTGGDYRIMEVEMFEPQLYYYLLRGEAQEKMLDMMVGAVKKRLGASMGTGGRCESEGRSGEDSEDDRERK